MSGAGTGTGQPDIGMESGLDWYRSGAETGSWDRPASPATMPTGPPTPGRAGTGPAATGAGPVTEPAQPRLVQGRASPAALDEATVEAAKRGDRQAWEHAYLAYGKALMGFLVLRLHDVDDAAEALSETFLRSLEKASTFRGDAIAFRAWLYRIARNVATDRLRARSRVHPVADPPELADLSLPGSDDGVIRHEEAAEARAALACLADDDQEVVWLRVCAGLSAEEVGRIVGKRAGAVRMQQMRSLESLARKLGR